MCPPQVSGSVRLTKMITDPRPKRGCHDAAVIRAGVFMVALVMGVSTLGLACGDRDDKAQIQSRAELLYRAAAEGRWADAYALFLPRDKPDTSIDRFITLFSNHRPFKCLGVRIRHLHDDDDPAYAADLQVGHRLVEASMRLSVEYPDGRHETIGHYSDLWVKSQGVWYFAANRKGPYE
jgi:hypothetical protein